MVADGRVLLRFRDFRRLLAVRLLSQLADGVYQVALATYVVFSPEKETSAGAIAAAMAVLLLPYSLLGPFAGVLLDRWRRRQVLLFGNLLRAGLALGTAVLVLAPVPTWLFYLSALSVTAVNRFVLAGLSAALPRVVDEERLVLANSLSPTAGTLVATLGGGLALALQVITPEGTDADAWVVLLAAGLYLSGGLAALRMGRGLLGPDPSLVQPRLLTAVAGTARGLIAGLRHLVERRTAGQALIAMGVLRFCYGALTVMVLMLCRYAWSDVTSDGLAMLGLAVGASGLGFFVAAVLTPWAARRFGRLGWMGWCATGAALLVPVLGLTFRPVPVLMAAFLLGAVTQGAKIATDTVVQATVDDGYRGRVFALYDMQYNVAFVGAAAAAALMLPPDGRSAVLVATVTALYGATAVGVFRMHARGRTGGD
ncbi:MFS transporter [Streptomyces sp. TRM 70351]|uniref:MFS transporter n=1 Tax=Streptomyces sp. TRM 70351 TaxID=3116552 RepID=UPI002E7C1FF1|nr:MFS transporter [Streptomyces sp. TRM 70351]MEE1930004.1 MFS transporter [Streptomyces sp. TRM 70351]